MRLPHLNIRIGEQKYSSEITGLVNYVKIEAEKDTMLFLKAIT